MRVHTAFERKNETSNSIISTTRIVTVSLIFIEFCIMVRNHVRKTAKSSYMEDDVNNAIEKIGTKEWTYEQASSLANIPIGILASRISPKSHQQFSRPTNLKTTEEKYLVDLIITLHAYGGPSTCDAVLRYATEFVDIMNLKSRFKNGKPTSE